VEEIMFDYVPENDDRNLAFCAAHFVKDSFQNLHEFNKKLLLKHEAVPTLKPEAAVGGPQPVSRLRLHHFKRICMSNSRSSLVFYFFFKYQCWLYSH